MNEAALSKKMVRRIKARGGWAVKLHGDPRQRRGLLDIAGCYRGYGLWLEVKLPNNKNGLTDLQAATIEHIRAAGGIAMEIRDIKTLNRLLDQIDRVRDG
jgi:hypothetical protein